MDKVKHQKIAFILSARDDYDKSDVQTWNKLFNEYWRMNADELDIEFNFYLNK